MYTTPISTLVSSLSLDHHLYANDTQLIFFPSTHATLTQAFLAFKTLFNRSLPGWLLIFLLLTPLWLNTCSSDLKTNLTRYTIPRLTPSTLLEISASSLTNILLFLTKLQLSPKPVAITFVNFAISSLSSIRQLTVPSLPLSFIHKLDYCNSLYYRLREIFRFASDKCLIRSRVKSFTQCRPVCDNLHFTAFTTHAATPTAVAWVAFSPLFLCLFVFFQTISQIPMQLESPDLTYKCSTMSPGNAFILGSKGQRSRSQRLCLQTERNNIVAASHAGSFLLRCPPHKQCWRHGVFPASLPNFRLPLDAWFCRRGFVHYCEFRFFYQIEEGFADSALSSNHVDRTALFKQASKKRFYCS